MAGIEMYVLSWVWRFPSRCDTVIASVFFLDTCRFLSIHPHAVLPEMTLDLPLVRNMLTVGLLLSTVLHGTCVYELARR